MPSAYENKVIAHYLDGSLLKGKTLDFLPSKPTFHLTDRDGLVHEVNIKELKALFFVKHHEGRPTYKERKGFFTDDAHAKKVMVEFFDGEVVFGYTISFSNKGLGFFMTPGDPGSNNEKIFVVRSSTKRIKIRAKGKNRPKVHK